MWSHVPPPPFSLSSSSFSFSFDTDRCSLPLWAYPILAQEIERLIANELFYRQEAIKRGIKQNPSILPRNDFDCVCEKVSSSEHREGRGGRHAVRIVMIVPGLGIVVCNVLY